MAEKYDFSNMFLNAEIKPIPNLQAELLPCPFCGSTSLKIESKHHGTHYYSGTHSATVRCNKCHARGSAASCKVEKGKYHADEETKQKAVELWNTRTPIEKGGAE